MKLPSELFGKKPSEPEPIEKKVTPEKPEPKRTEAVYLTETVTFDMHPYRSADEGTSRAILWIVFWDTMPVLKRGLWMQFLITNLLLPTPTIFFRSCWVAGPTISAKRFIT